MSEVRPQISYSDDDVLTVRGYTDSSRLDECATRAQEVADRTGVEANVTFTEIAGFVAAKVAVADYFEGDLSQDECEQRAASLLLQLAPIGRRNRHIDFMTPEEAADTSEDVLSIDRWLAGGGVTGVIHPQFYRWLASDFDAQAVASKLIRAMFMPADEVTKAVGMAGHANATAGPEGIVLGFTNGLSCGVTCNPREFRVSQQLMDKDGQENYRTGTGIFMNPYMTTVGGFASCWSLEGQQKLRHYLDIKGLCELVPGNIDTYRQSLSLVLGAAVLADEAAKYPGREDIFANVEWDESSAT
jgi:hypothetical protein